MADEFSDLISVTNGLGGKAGSTLRGVSFGPVLLRQRDIMNELGAKLIE
jgi:hypothetical protein